MLPKLFTIPIIDYEVHSYGFMLMIGFFAAAYFAVKRAEKVRANPDVVLNCAILALLGSIVGARLFYVLHFWEEQFAHQPQPFITAFKIGRGGMEMFGGVAGALVCILAYLIFKRESIRLYFDVLTPGLMLGLALGRIGCFLNGCCWGGVCDTSIAQRWAVQFPYGSPAHYRQYENRKVKVPAELLQANPLGVYVPIPREQVFADPATRDQNARLLAEAKRQYQYTAQLSPDSDDARIAKGKVEKYEKLAQEEVDEYAAVNRRLQMFWSQEYPGQKITPSELAHKARYPSLPVHPAQLYATVNAFFGAAFLSLLFRRRRRHGMVFAAWLLTYPWTRLILEYIREDNPADTFGLTVSSSLSLAMIASGVVLALWFRWLPLQSPYAKPPK